MTLKTNTSSAGPESMINSSRARTIKLRAACNQCNVAKVRCSGEKTGCERCQNLGIKCIYGESRVGKVPGLRARKKSGTNQTATTQTRESAGLITQSTQEIENHNLLVQSFTSSIMEDAHTSVMRWTTGSNTIGSEEDSLDAVSIAHVAQHTYDNTNGASDVIAPLPASTELLMSQGIEFDLDDFMGYPMNQTSEDFGLRPATTSIADNTQEKRLVDIQCIVACCQIVVELEGYVNEDVRSLQIVLGVVKKAMEKVNELHTLQQSFRTPRCMAMFAVIMYQVVALLEGGCTSFLNPHDNHISGLALGGLGMSPEDQSFYRTHLLLKTIEQASELLLKGKKLADIRESGSNHPAAAPEDPERCFAQLEGKLRSLNERISAAK